MCETSNRPAWVRVQLCSAMMPGRILDRHGIAGERHHARAERAMGCGERRLAENVGSRLVRPNGRSSTGYGSAAPDRHGPAAPPLSEDLRDFPAFGRSSGREKWFALFPETLPAGYSFGEPTPDAPAAFQSVADRPVLRPESFRGGCSFGAGPNSRSGLSRRSWQPAIHSGLAGTRLRSRRRII